MKLTKSKFLQLLKFQGKIQRFEFILLLVFSASVYGIPAIFQNSIPNEVWMFLKLSLGVLSTYLTLAFSIARIRDWSKPKRFKTHMIIWLPVWAIHTAASWTPHFLIRTTQDSLIATGQEYTALQAKMLNHLIHFVTDQDYKIIIILVAFWISFSLTFFYYGFKSFFAKSWAEGQPKSQIHQN